MGTYFDQFLTNFETEANSLKGFEVQTTCQTNICKISQYDKLGEKISSNQNSWKEKTKVCSPSCFNGVTLGHFNVFKHKKDETVLSILFLYPRKYDGDEKIASRLQITGLALKNGPPIVLEWDHFLYFSFTFWV